MRYAVANVQGCRESCKLLIFMDRWDCLHGVVDYISVVVSRQNAESVVVTTFPTSVRVVRAVHPFARNLTPSDKLRQRLAGISSTLQLSCNSRLTRRTAFGVVCVSGCPGVMGAPLSGGTRNRGCPVATAGGGGRSMMMRPFLTLGYSILLLIAGATQARAEGPSERLTLARYIPKDVWITVQTLGNPERKYIHEQWGEVWDAVRKAR